MFSEVAASLSSLLIIFFSTSRPMGQRIARLLPKPRARVRIPGEAWMFPCVVQLGVEMAHPPGAPSQVGHQCRRPPELPLTCLAVGFKKSTHRACCNNKMAKNKKVFICSDVYRHPTLPKIATSLSSPQIIFSSIYFSSPVIT